MKREVLMFALVVGLLGFASSSRVFAGHSVAAASAPAASAAAIDVRQFYPLMTVSTSHALEIPGRVLPPGEYVFRLINSDQEVEITRADGTSYGTYRVMPAFARTTGDGRVLTAEDPDGGPDRIDSWFFPAQQDGYALAYPNSE